MVVTMWQAPAIKTIAALMLTKGFAKDVRTLKAVVGLGLSRAVA